MKKVKGNIISKGLRDLIDEKKEITGQIHSVYKNACNIELNDSRFITLLDINKSLVPMSLSLNMDKEGFYEYRIFKGANVDIINNELIVKNTMFKISTDIKDIWEENAEFNYDKNTIDNVASNLKVLKQHILLNGKLNAASHMLRFVNEAVPNFIPTNDVEKEMDNDFGFIKESFIEFINCYTNGNIENVSKAASKVIGFGYGLTPSVDDFIAGLMISTIYVNNYFDKDIENKKELNKNIIKNSLHRTTRISAEMLKHAVNGSGSQYVKNLLINILSISDKNVISKDIQKLLSTGETSGTDIASGIYTGLKMGFS